MPYNRRALEGREGDPALVWWRAVWQWANSLPVVLGPGMTLTQVPGYGTAIKVRTAAPVRVFFEVALSGNEAVIRPGYLDGDAPFVKDRKGEMIALDADTAPTLDLRNTRPDPDGRSAIVLIARVDEKGDRVDPEEDPTALRIEHRSDFGTRAKKLAALAGEPFHELAILYWRDGQIDRVAQIVQHNLGIAAGSTSATSDEDKAERYFFYAAG